MKVKLPPVPGLPSDLKMFLDHKGYRLDDLIYIQIMLGALVIYKTTEVPIVKYQAKNPKNQMSFSIWFLSNNDGLLYWAMKNVYPVFIVRFPLRLTTVSNWKLHITAFCELFCLIPTFSLPLFNDFQLSLPSFLEPLPNPHKAIVALQLVLKSPMVLRTLDPLYYTPAETVVTNEVIAITISEFVVKAIDNENKHLRRYIICLMDNLEPLQFSYLT